MQKQISGLTKLMLLTYEVFVKFGKFDIENKQTEQKLNSEIEPSTFGVAVGDDNHR
jgi:hypothetical protein